MSNEEINDNGILITAIRHSGETKVYINGIEFNRFQILALASKIDDLKIAKELLKIASICFHPLDDWVFDELYDSVMIEISFEENFRESEYGIHSLFRKNYSKIRNGIVVNRKSDGRNIPDAWVQEENIIIPVEMKKDKFDKKALCQLKRYMKTYKSEKGIAVAKELTVNLPENIEFISVEELKSEQ